MFFLLEQYHERSEFMFHVDRFSQTEPVLRFRLFWLHVSHAPAENLEVGV